MAKRKSQDGDYTKFSLPQPHHPSTQPKADKEVEPPERPPESQPSQEPADCNQLTGEREAE